MTNETHLIMVADFGVLRYRSGSLHNVNSLIVISERNTVSQPVPLDIRRGA